jgi:hypothetical protein
MRGELQEKRVFEVNPRLCQKISGRIIREGPILAAVSSCPNPDDFSGWSMARSTKRSGY